MQGYLLAMFCDLFIAAELCRHKHLDPGLDRAINEFDLLAYPLEAQGTNYCILAFESTTELQLWVRVVHRDDSESRGIRR